MALVFKEVSTATIKIQDATSTDMFTIPGVTTGTTTAVNAAEQINKILDIAGFEAEANNKMSRVLTEEVVNDG